MALPNLSGLKIKDTYPRLLQNDSGTLRDGTGSLVDLTNITVTSTGSFGRLECTTLSASIGEFDANTIKLGGVSLNKADLDNLKEGKSMTTSPKSLDFSANNWISPEAIISTTDDTTYQKFTVPGRVGQYVSGTLFVDQNLSGSNNYISLGDGNTNIKLKGNINEATLDGGTF